MLGSWQVKRLIWKENLIAKVEERIEQTPVSVTGMTQDEMRAETSNYLPAFAEGTFDHSAEVFFFTTGKGGASGWNIHTPLKMQDGRTLIINRGFVLNALKEAGLRKEGQIEGPVKITGLLRVPVKEKPNSFFPDNDMQKREFFWRDHPAMASLMGNEIQKEFLPVFLDANERENPGGWPKGGATIVSFSNSHLQYAITWFGLAGALLVVGGFFVFSRTKNMAYNRIEK